MVEGAIFVSLVIIEGMITNVENVVTSSIGDLFPYDVVVLLCLDSILYLKLNLFFLLEGRKRFMFRLVLQITSSVHIVHGPTNMKGQQFSIPDILYNLVMVMVTLSYCYLFVTYHLTLLGTVKCVGIGFDISNQGLLIVMIVICITHNITGTSF
jgi:hypothetical protein